MNEVTQLPTRAEMKARRSRQMHLQRVQAAPTPQDAAMAAIARARAVLVRGDDQFARELTEQLMALTDKAERLTGEGRRNVA